MTVLRITPLEPGEEHHVAAIHNAAFGMWQRTLDPAYGCQDVTPDEVEAWMRQPDSRLLIAWLEHMPVGYAYARIVELAVGGTPLQCLHFDETTSGFGQSRIGVLPEYHLQEIAADLIDAHLNEASRLNVPLATVIAYNDNPAASLLCTSKGFFHREAYYLPELSEEEPLAIDTIFSTRDLSQPPPTLELNPALRIRYLRESDLPAIQRIFGESSPWVYGSQPSEDNIRRWLHEPWSEVTLVGEIDGQVVGVMGFSNRGLISLPGVLPGYQGQGIGATLGHYLLQEMAAHGHATALTAVPVTQKAAQRLCDKLGFHVERRRWTWVKQLG